MTTRKKTTSVVELNSDVDRAEFEPRAELFTIDGVSYSARTNFSATETLKYFRIGRKSGADAAVDWAMEAALGEDGYLAFLDYPYLSKDKARAIVDQILSRLVGVEIDPK